MLKWMYENVPNRDKAKNHTIVKIVIGEDYYKELDKMGFIKREYVLVDGYVWLSYLGNEYCKEIFVVKKKDLIFDFVKNLHTKYNFIAKYAEYEGVDYKFYFIEIDEYLNKNDDYCKDVLRFMFEYSNGNEIILFTSESENLYHDDITNWEII